MRRILIASAALFAALLPFASEEGLAQKKKGLKGVVKATPEEYAQIQNQKELIGQLGFADEKALSVRLEFQYLEPNPGFRPGGGGGRGGTNLQRLYAEIQRDYAEIARARNPIERQRRMQELQRDMQRLQMEMVRAKKGTIGGKGGAGPFKTVTSIREFDLDMGDKVIVRWANPPFEYDDKGEVKKYTKEELTKLRGNDPKLPGYTATLENLVPGQKIKLSVIPPGKKKQKLTADLDAVDRPTVTMIVILEESSLPYIAPKGKKK